VRHIFPRKERIARVQRVLFLAQIVAQLALQHEDHLAPAARRAVLLAARPCLDQPRLELAVWRQQREDLHRGAVDAQAHALLGGDEHAHLPAVLALEKVRHLDAEELRQPAEIRHRYVDLVALQTAEKRRC
jgi:hypothetical protein